MLVAEIAGRKTGVAGRSAGILAGRYARASILLTVGRKSEDCLQGRVVCLNEPLQLQKLVQGDPADLGSSGQPCPVKEPIASSVITNLQLCLYARKLSTGPEQRAKHPHKVTSALWIDPNDP